MLFKYIYYFGILMIIWKYGGLRGHMLAGEDVWCKEKNSVKTTFIS